MIEILTVGERRTRDSEAVVRDREGRRVGTAHERGGERYLEFDTNAPANVRRVLDTEADDGRVRLESRFVAEVRDDDIRLRI